MREEKSAKLVYQPVGDNIQIDFDAGPAQIGGIFLPDNAKKAPTILVRVIAVGPLCKQIKAGQRAVVTIPQVLVLKLNGEEVAFTKEDRVLAVLD